MNNTFEFDLDWSGDCQALAEIDTNVTTTFDLEDDFSGFVSLNDDVVDFMSEIAGVVEQFMFEPITPQIQMEIVDELHKVGLLDGQDLIDAKEEIAKEAVTVVYNDLFSMTFSCDESSGGTVELIDNPTEEMYW